MKKQIVIFFVSFLLFFKINSQTLTLIKDINSGNPNSFPESLTLFNGKIYFTATGLTGKLIWESDGTSSGTQLVGPITNSYGVVYDFVAFNGNLFFSYDDLTGTTGRELWISDGTSAGTMLLKDIKAGALPSNPQYFTECNGKLFFQADDLNGTQRLWVTDGTIAGTLQVKNMYAVPGNGGERYMVFNNKIYFNGNDGISGYNLWSSDGTLAGTVLVKQLNVNFDGYYAKNQTHFFFSAATPTNGTEVWMSDGTTAGTNILKDIIPGNGNSYPTGFLYSNGKIYFSATDGTNGQELWVSDGTNTGTQMIKDIFIGTGSSNPHSLIEFNNEVYFFASDDLNGVKMFKTDGTLAGTQLVSASYVSSASSNYSYIYNSNLYFFCGYWGNFNSLWKTDGTTNGTNQISPQINAYMPSNYRTVVKFVNFGSDLYLQGSVLGAGAEFCKLSTLQTPLFEKENYLTPEINLFPNPSSNILNITGYGKIINIDFYTSNGRLLKSLSNSSNTVDISDLPSGIYFLKLYDDTNRNKIQKLFKVVKQ